MATYGKVLDVAEGDYDAVLEEVRETDHPEYGPGLMMIWKIRGGDFDGQTVCRTMKPNLKKKVNFGKFAAGLAGCGFDELPDSFDPEKYIGTLYRIRVEEADSGSSRVEMIVQKLDGDGGVPF